MNDIVKIPSLNPIRFYLEGTETDHIDTVPTHEQFWLAGYYQKFCQTDLLNLQVLLLDTWYTSIGIKVIRKDQPAPVFSSSGWSGGAEAGTSYYRFKLTDTDLFDRDAGIYQLAIEVTVYDSDAKTSTKVLTFLSEYIEIADTHPNTLLIGYTHDINDFDLKFIGYTPAPVFYFRVEGGVNSDGFKPAAKDSFYVDQERSVVLLESVPYNVETFTFGNGRGVPNWVADKLNRILSCSGVTINGKAYVKNDGSKLEAISDKGFPLSGWKIDLVTNSNFYSNTYSND